MKVFIIWSGARSKPAAEAFHDWLPQVLDYVEPRLNRGDTDAGDRLSAHTFEEVESSHFGLLCLTHDNMTDPWLLFEAGVLAKSTGHECVIPLLLDRNLTDVSGPLSQFQAKKADRVSMLEVARSINRNAEDPIDAERLENLFETTWPSLEQQLKQILGKVGPRQARSQKDLFKAVAATVKSIDKRTQEIEIAYLDRLQLVRAVTDLEVLVPKDVTLEAKHLVEQNKHVYAIKLVRDSAKLSVQEAKYLVDTWRDQLRKE